jgi:hypothetical protein
MGSALSNIARQLGTDDDDDDGDDDGYLIIGSRALG